MSGTSLGDLRDQEKVIVEIDVDVSVSADDAEIDAVLVITDTPRALVAETQLDGQSRIVIPRELLQFAGIEDQVLIVGVLERIEVWNPKEYEGYMTSQTESYENVAQAVFHKKSS